MAGSSNRFITLWLPRECCSLFLMLVLRHRVDTKPKHCELITTDASHSSVSQHRGCHLKEHVYCIQISNKGKYKRYDRSMYLTGRLCSSHMLFQHRQILLWCQRLHSLTLLFPSSSPKLSEVSEQRVPLASKTWCLKLQNPFFTMALGLYGVKLRGGGPWHRGHILLTNFTVFGPSYLEVLKSLFLILCYEDVK